MRRDATRQAAVELTGQGLNDTSDIITTTRTSFLAQHSLSASASASSSSSSSSAAASAATAPASALFASYFLLPPALGGGSVHSIDHLQALYARALRAAPPPLLPAADAKAEDEEGAGEGDEKWDERRSAQLSAQLEAEANRAFEQALQKALGKAGAAAPASPVPAPGAGAGVLDISLGDAHVGAAPEPRDSLASLKPIPSQSMWMLSISILIYPSIYLYIYLLMARAHYITVWRGVASCGVVCCSDRCVGAECGQWRRFGCEQRRRKRR
jgi:hypothetical protein